MTTEVERPFQSDTNVVGNEEQVWGGGEDTRQEEVASRAPALSEEDTDGEENVEHVLEPQVPVPPALPAPEGVADTPESGEQELAREEVTPEPVSRDAPLQGDVQQEVYEEEEEEAEEATLGSTILKPADTPTQESAPNVSDAIRSESPEYEPEVLPVLSIGLPARVSSLQIRQLHRSSSSPSISSTKTDTSAPELRTTELPTFATPTPMAAVRFPVVGDLGMGARTPPTFVSSSGMRDQGMPLSENSKSKQFNQRLDYMVGEFFTRQVAKLATSTPESVDRIQKLFSQRVREKLGQQVGKQWAHVTAQPEVDESAKEIEAMYSYFSQLEKMVEKQRSALQQLNEVEAELSLFYQQKGYQELHDDIGKNLVHLGVSYHQECKERVPVIASLDAYLAFLKTFKGKAINDSRDTIKLQKTARQEFDSYASRLGYLEEKNMRASSSSSSTSSFNPLRNKSSEDTAKYQEKELDQTRQRFQTAKTRYQVLSTQVIDKAGLLEMKRGVDFGAYVGRVVEAHDAYGARHFEAGKVRADGYYTPDSQAEGVASPINYQTDGENASR
ncbi:hypothetical protein PhCBS80983_g02813 [Powellomyces hirtus]|uniref:AH domain-containing protein n=1 Tax=Powellomyces hirtus TaxID=109895 RepID=A0A507E6P7_9FUNG|nr:hypothetical protein PhCBS80983_g02813 [Powellomyces hirtus]